MKDFTDNQVFINHVYEMFGKDDSFLSKNDINEIISKKTKKDKIPGMAWTKMRGGVNK